MTEAERMHAGMIYDALDPELGKVVTRTRQLCLEYNRMDLAEEEKRNNLLKDIFQIEEIKGYLAIEPPVIVDDGKGIYLKARR